MIEKNTFSDFYNFENSYFISKKIYSGKLEETGPTYDFRYSLHPHRFRVPRKHELLDYIKDSTLNLIHSCNSNGIREFESFLLSTHETEFVSFLANGLYDENIIEDYTRFLQQNHLAENEGYFAINFGGYVYEIGTKIPRGQFLKWKATLNTPIFKKPEIITISKYLEFEGLENNNEYFHFNKHTKYVDYREVEESFKGVLSYSKSIKLYPEITKNIFEDFSLSIIRPLFPKYHVNGLVDSLFDMDLIEILNLDSRLNKPIIH